MRGVIRLNKGHKSCRGAWMRSRAPCPGRRIDTPVQRSETAGAARLDHAGIGTSSPSHASGQSAATSPSVSLIANAMAPPVSAMRGRSSFSPGADVGPDAAPPAALLIRKITGINRYSKRTPAPYPATATVPEALATNAVVSATVSFRLKRGDCGDGADAENIAKQWPTKARQPETRQVASGKDVPEKSCCSSRIEEDKCYAGSATLELWKRTNPKIRQGESGTRTTTPAEIATDGRGTSTLAGAGGSRSPSAFISQSKILPGKTTLEWLALVCNSPSVPSNAR